MTLPPLPTPHLPGELSWTPDWESRGTGVRVQEVREYVLDGLPVLRGGHEIPAALIMQSIDAAEDKVEKDLDILIWERDVHCVSDQDDSDLDDSDTRVLLGALDKPRNWFAGDRFGVLRLPRAPAKRLIRVTLLPYGPLARPLELPIDDPRYAQPRLDRNKVRFVPGRMGIVLPMPQSIMAFFVRDGFVIPNGIEIVYRAGLSRRQLRQQAPMIRLMVIYQAAILTLGLVQGRMMGGAQKESVASDNLQNSVETAKRDQLGPLGGEIKALKATYNELKEAVASDQNLSWVFMG